MRFGHFKGMSDEEAAVALAGWARRQRIAIAFDVRRVRNVQVIFVLLAAR